MPGDVKDYYKKIQDEGAKKEKDFDAKFVAYEVRTCVRVCSPFESTGATVY